MFGFFKFFKKKKDQKAEKLRRSIALDVQKISSETAAREKSLLEKYFSDVANRFANFENLFLGVDARLLKLEADRLSNFENLLSSLNERLSKLEENSHQAMRQERRRQAALESLLEQQQKTLDILERPQLSPPLEAVMALVENFVLAYPKGSPTSDVLYGKLTDLMECFGLSLVEETGVDFDAEIHETCGANFDPSYPENAVLEIVSPGFLLNGKVLRYAIVIVNRRLAGQLEEPRAAPGKFESNMIEEPRQVEAEEPIALGETRFGEFQPGEVGKSSQAMTEKPPIESGEARLGEFEKPSQAASEEEPIAPGETRFSDFGIGGV
ncbi:MAG: nucleotide exchange factor GrpE [Synergistaceae bacterium]|jgi:molecular chaperone GrpE (heat shock protein)|nr:nucleotide exchange factor GrpE [Synergistaceae bacterium]